MTSSRYSHVTDELLSAYLDQAVTDEERGWVEAAVAAEPQIAWRLETLRQTVRLLHTLPAVALPRSFVLSELQLSADPSLAAKPTTAAAHRRSVAAQPQTGRAGFWQAWQEFWRVGSPPLRNAAAVSFAVLLVLFAGNFLVAPQPVASPAPAPEQVAAPALLEPSTSVAMAQPTLQPPAEVAAASDEAMDSQAQSEPSAKIASQQSAPALAAVDTVVAAEAAAPAMGGQSGQVESFSADAPPGPDESVQFLEEVPGAEAAAMREREMQAASVSTPVTTQLFSMQSEVTTTDALSETLLTGETAVVVNTISQSVAYSATANAAPAAAQVMSRRGEMASPIGTALISTTAVGAANETTVATDAASTVERTANEPATKLPTAATPDSGRMILQWAQLGAALLTLILIVLWWRSRSQMSKSA